MVSALKEAFEKMDSSRFIKVRVNPAREFKVFLGGTTAGKDYRNELIPLLDEKGYAYFNPVVDNWTEESRVIEEQEKDKSLIHFYALTPDMQGFYSVAEIMESLHTRGVYTVLYVEDSLKWRYWNGNDVTESLRAVSELVLRGGGFLVESLARVPLLLTNLGLEATKHLAPSVEFTIQSDVISEVGVNGVQIADVVRYSKYVIEALNRRFPSKENEQSLVKLEEFLMWQDLRTKNRTLRGVEGKNIK